MTVTTSDSAGSSAPAAGETVSHELPDEAVKMEGNRLPVMVKLPVKAPGEASVTVAGATTGAPGEDEVTVSVIAIFNGFAAPTVVMVTVDA